MKEILNKKQFDVLEQYALNNVSLPQRELAEKTKYSLGSINGIVKELSEQRYVNDKGITKRV